jgi:hypothetical protein
MIYLRILTVFLAVGKVLLGGLFVFVADCNASHAFGAGGYRPPDWRRDDILLAVAGIVLAFPHVLFRSRKVLSLIFVAIPAVLMLETVDNSRADVSATFLVVFVLSVGEWLLQHYAFAEKTTRSTSGIAKPRTDHPGHSEEAVRQSSPVAVLLVVAKVLVGLFLLMVAYIDAHPNFFGPEGPKPPDWRLEHFLLILSGIGVAYPQSLIPTHRLLSILVMVISAIPLLLLASGGAPWKEGLVATSAMFRSVPFLLTVAESRFRRPLSPKTKKEGGL